jgi:hypothetical protein
MNHRTHTRRLQEIVAALHPWLRSRISTIGISPALGGRWEAVLTYVAKTLPPPPDLQIAAAEATEPMDTHHALALPPVGIETALREQVRELAEISELGTLQIEKFPATPLASRSPGGPAADPHLSQAAWQVKTHAGLLRQRRTWLSRIGRPDLGR